MNLLHRITAVLGGCALAACSLFVTVPNLSDGPLVTANAADAAVPHADGAVLPETGDAGLCVGLGANVFCDDFDQSPPFGTWDRLVQGPGFTVTTDSQQSPPSRPNALLAKIDGTVQEECSYARAEKQFRGSFDRVRLSFSFRAGGPPATLDDETIAAQSLDGDNAGCQVLTALAWNGSSYDLRIVEQVVKGQQVTSQDHAAGTMRPDVWQRLTVDVSYGAKTIVVHDGDGTERLHEPLVSTCPSSPNPATVAVGFHCSKPKSTSREVRIDDVTFDPIGPL